MGGWPDGSIGSAAGWILSLPSPGISHKVYDHRSFYGRASSARCSWREAVISSIEISSTETSLRALLGRAAAAEACDQLPSSRASLEAFQHRSSPSPVLSQATASPEGRSGPGSANWSPSGTAWSA